MNRTLKKKCTGTQGSVGRRGFLKWSGALGAGLVLGGRARAAGGLLLSNRAIHARIGPTRPNILFIISDEHNAAVLGAAGNSIIHTSSLDLLARRGITFESCYCNSPLCVPSRLSFTAGKYASRVAVWSNNCWLPSPDYPSLARVLNAAGYESFLCGKMHYDRTRRYGFAEIGESMNNSKKTGTGSRRDPDNLTPKEGISARFDKFYTAEDSGVLKHAARVLLIISWTARWKGGQRRTGVCSLLDVNSTIAELAGTKVPPDWDGDSMVEWLDDDKAGWKDYAISEYYAHNIYSGYAMLRAGRFKYVYHTRPDAAHRPERELYDLYADPGEFNNLAGQPEYAERVEAMHEFLVRQLGEDPEQTEQRCRDDYEVGYSRS